MGDILSQDEVEEVLTKNAPPDDLVAKTSPADINRYLTAMPEAERAAFLDRKLTGKEIKKLKEDYEVAAREGRLYPWVCSYDFKHPARVNKDQLRTLENLHDNFARLLSSTFSGAMRAVVDVDTAFVDQTTYAEFIMSLSNPSCSYEFTLGPTNGRAILDFAMPIVFASVDRIFGGTGSSEGVDARQLSQIEMGVLATIVKRVVVDLESTWEPILRVEISDIELETNPEFMQITAPSEIVILLAFEVNSSNMSGLISLCYPFFTLEPILPRLGQQSYVRRPRANQEQLRLENRLRLGSMDVPAVAELGRTRISVTEAESLGQGDVIRLPTRTADPVRVFVGGKPKFLAWPCAKGEDLELHVAGKVPPHAQRRYGQVGVGEPAEGESKPRTWIRSEDV